MSQGMRLGWQRDPLVPPPPPSPWLGNPSVIRLAKTPYSLTMNKFNEFIQRRCCLV